MRILYITIAMLTIFSSCKKDEEPVDPCTNGFLDPGETSIDCGGTCDPCSVSQPEFFTIFVNGQQEAMTFREIFYDGTSWSFQMSNASISMQISLGTSGIVQTADIPTAGTYASVNGVDYPIQANGTYAISSHDLSTQTMSGFFGIDFVREISTGPSVYDTLKISGGQFEFFHY
ncbi:MAG: hypothetical protein ACI865_002834 [Flavobacteriaceae bacterium]|jgi:hypothetical protein